MLRIEWAGGAQNPMVEVTSKIATRDRAIDLTKPGRPAPLSAAERKFNTQGTELIPVDGIVKQTSDQIIAAAAAESDVEKARAIYEWIVDNTFRDAKTRGCGIGDIAAMLDPAISAANAPISTPSMSAWRGPPGSGARPVRDPRCAFEIRLQEPRRQSEVITKAQHCRAEAYLADFGWVPVDPADVRKVVLEEPPGQSVRSTTEGRAAREGLFGVVGG